MSTGSMVWASVDEHMEAVTYSALQELADNVKSHLQKSRPSSSTPQTYCWQWREHKAPGPFWGCAHGTACSHTAPALSMDTKHIYAGLACPQQ